jgi:hypothetical protein
MHKANGHLRGGKFGNFQKEDKVKKNKAKDTAPVAESKIPVPENAVPVEIDDKTFYLSFDFQDLAEAESHFKRQGHRVNLLWSLPQQSLQSVQEVFPCLVYKHHQLGFEEAQKLITINSAYTVATAIMEAFNRAGGRATAQEASSNEQPTV